MARSSTFFVRCIPWLLAAFCPVAFSRTLVERTLQQHVLAPNLTHIYDIYNDTPGFFHWMEYGRFYQHNLNHLFHLPDLPDNNQIHMLEIGVQSGGSTRVWRQFFGDRLVYTGIDINPNCKQFEDLANGIRIEIGSQTDTVFLEDICRKYGPFHLIVDDGAHTTAAIMMSLDVLWPCLRDQGVYAVEDLHTMSNAVDLMPGMRVNGKDFYDFLRDLTFSMVSYFKPGGQTETPTDKFASHLSAVHVYDSMAFLHYRKEWQPLHSFKKGSRFIEYIP